MPDDDIQRIYDIWQRVEFRKQAGQLERDIWIKAARLFFHPGDRQPCHVCGRFSSITQAHHVVPLTTQYDRGFGIPDNEFVWLCPNHHVMVHLYIQSDDRSMTRAAFKARSATLAPVHPDLSEAEFEKILDLMGRSGRGPQ